MKVDVRLFALMRQLVGSPTVTLELPDESTIGDLRLALQKEHPALAPLLPYSLFAIGDQYAAEDARLREGGDLACIPPVSGG